MSTQGDGDLYRAKLAQVRNRLQKIRADFTRQDAWDKASGFDLSATLRPSQAAYVQGLPDHETLGIPSIFSQDQTTKRVDPAKRHEVPKDLSTDNPLEGLEGARSQGETVAGAAKDLVTFGAEGVSSGIKAVAQAPIDLLWHGARLLSPVDKEGRGPAFLEPENKPSVGRFVEGIGRAMEGREFGSVLGEGLDPDEAARAGKNPAAAAGQKAGTSGGTILSLAVTPAGGFIAGVGNTAVKGVAEFAPRLAFSKAMKNYAVYDAMRGGKVMKAAGSAIHGAAGFGAYTAIVSEGDLAETARGAMFGAAYSLAGLLGDKGMAALVQRGVNPRVAAGAVRALEPFTSDLAVEAGGLGVFAALNKIGVTETDLRRVAPLVGTTWDTIVLEQERQALLESGNPSEADLQRIKAIESRITENDKIAWDAFLEYTGESMFMGGFGYSMRSQAPAARRWNSPEARRQYDKAVVDNLNASLPQNTQQLGGGRSNLAYTVTEPVKGLSDADVAKLGKAQDKRLQKQARQAGEVQKAINAREIRPLLADLYAAGAEVRPGGLVKRPGWRGWQILDADAGNPVVKTHTGEVLKGKAAVEYTAKELADSGLANLKLRRALASSKFDEDLPGLLTYRDGDDIREVTIGRDGGWRSRPIVGGKRTKKWSPFDIEAALADVPPKAKAEEATQDAVAAPARRAPGLSDIGIREFGSMALQARQQLKTMPDSPAKTSAVEKLDELEDFVRRAGGEDAMTKEVEAAVRKAEFREVFAKDPANFMVDLARTVEAGESVEGMVHRWQERGIDQAKALEDIETHRRLIEKERAEDNAKAEEAEPLKAEPTDTERGSARIGKPLTDLGQSLKEGTLGTLKELKYTGSKTFSRAINYGAQRFGAEGEFIRDSVLRFDDRAKREIGNAKMDALEAIEGVLGRQGMTRESLGEKWRRRGRMDPLPGVKHNLSNIPEKLEYDVFNYVQYGVEGKDPRAKQIGEALRPIMDRPIDKANEVDLTREGGPILKDKNGKVVMKNGKPVRLRTKISRSKDGAYFSQRPNEKGELAFKQAEAKEDGPELKELLDELIKLPSWQDFYKKKSARIRKTLEKGGHTARAREDIMRGVERRLLKRVVRREASNWIAGRDSWLESRRFKLPIGFVDTGWIGSFGRTLEKAYTRIEATREFGGPEYPALTKAYDEIAKRELRENDGSTQDLEKFKAHISAELGTVPPAHKPNKWAKKGFGFTRSLATLATIGLKITTTALNAGQVPITMIANHGLMNTLKAYKRVPPLLHFIPGSKWEAELNQMVRDAARKGVMSLDTFIRDLTEGEDGNRILNDIVSLSLKGSGMNRQEGANQVRAGMISRLWLDQNLPKIEAFLKENAPDSPALGWVKRAHFRQTPEDLIRNLNRHETQPFDGDFDFTPEQRDRYERSIVQNTQFTKSASNHTMSRHLSPGIELLMQFKHFPTNMMGLFYRNGIQEGFKHGNWAPMVKFATASAVTTGLIRGIVDLLLEQEKSWITKTINGQPASEVLGAMVANLLSGGLFGFTSDITEYGLGSTLKGPSVSTAEKVIESGVAVLGQGIRHGPVAALRETMNSVTSTIGGARDISQFYQTLRGLIGDSSQGAYTVARNYARTYGSEADEDFWDAIEEKATTALKGRQGYKKTAGSRIRRDIAQQVVVRQADDAERAVVDLLYVAETREERIKALRGLRISAMAWSPYGRISKERREKMLSEATPGMREYLEKTQSEYLDYYNEVVLEGAMEAWDGMPASAYGWKNL